MALSRLAEAETTCSYSEFTDQLYRDLLPQLMSIVLDTERRIAALFEERDRIEGESLEFHERVRASFLRLAAADPDHYLVLDARLPAEEIAAAVRASVAPLLGAARRVVRP